MTMQIKSATKRFVSACVALSLCHIVSATDVSATDVSATEVSALQKQQLTELHQQVVKDDLSYQLLESLTTEVGHRMAGSEGDKKAVAWAMNKMRALGFDKVWKEEFEVPNWQRGDIKVKVMSPFPHDFEALALGGSVGTDNQTLQAEVVHFTDFDALKAVPDGSLEGKIAFISYRMERHIDGKGYGKAVGARSAGASVAAQKGAIAFVLRSVGTDNNRHAHTGTMRYAEGIKKIPALAISNPDADVLVNQFKRNQAVQMSIRMEAQSSPKPLTTYNVIGEITGSELPDQYVALGAHLDSWDVGTGAIDDGLGVAMIISAAHQVKTRLGQPKRTIRVILFGAEEIGLLGARDYVKTHADSLHKHVIGYEWDFGNGPIYKLTPGVGPVALNAIHSIANVLAPLGVALDQSNTAKGQSDMSALGYSGVPAVNFAPDGSDYFDYHHTPNDTLDKVNVDALKFNTGIYALFTAFAANSSVDFRK